MNGYSNKDNSSTLSQPERAALFSTTSVKNQVRNKLGQPGAGYFAIAELKRLNSGFYHDGVHALEVANLAVECALMLKHSEHRAEFLKQVALVHDADPRLCQDTGRAKLGTPARVQATLAWMESERERLERRFSWEDLQFAEACALVARTDFPFDRKPRHCGTRFDGMDPVDVYREFLWKLPRQQREQCFNDALLLRFIDQIAAYVGTFERALQSVHDLVDELNNTGAELKLQSVLSNTPGFLSSIGLDLHYDRQLVSELNVPNLKLHRRSNLINSLGLKRRFALARNTLRFRCL